MPGNDTDHVLSPDTRLAFIGGGNMARSLIGGLLASGAPKAAIAVADPNAETREALARDFGVRVHDANNDAAREADVLLLAVKPQAIREVSQGLRDTVQATRPLVISIAAGVRIGQLDQWLGGNIAIVRVMPNTPALIGAGASGLCAGRGVDARMHALAERILASAGLVRWVDDEALMDTVTALSGSGPAYFFALVEALEDAAAAQGLPRETARALATQTCLGAGRMLAENDEAPAELRRRVTSPGGTTAAALASFETDHLHDVVARAVAAATRRGGELSAALD